LGFIRLFITPVNAGKRRTRPRNRKILWIGGHRPDRERGPTEKKGVGDGKFPGIFKHSGLRKKKPFGGEEGSPFARPSFSQLGPSRWEVPHNQGVPKTPWRGDTLHILSFSGGGPHNGVWLGSPREKM